MASAELVPKSQLENNAMMEMATRLAQRRKLNY
jgi:hypothetical protein